MMPRFNVGRKNTSSLQNILSMVNLRYLSSFATCPPYNNADQQHAERQQNDKDEVDSTGSLAIHDDGLILRLLCSLKLRNLAEEIVKLSCPEQAACRDFQVQHIGAEQGCILVAGRILAADQHDTGT